MCCSAENILKNLPSALSLSILAWVNITHTYWHRRFTYDVLPNIKKLESANSRRKWVVIDTDPDGRIYYCGNCYHYCDGSGAGPNGLCRNHNNTSVLYEFAHITFDMYKLNLAQNIDNAPQFLRRYLNMTAESYFNDALSLEVGSTKYLHYEKLSFCMTQIRYLRPWFDHNECMSEFKKVHLVFDP